MKVITSLLSLFLLAACLDADEKATTADKKEKATSTTTAAAHPGLKDPSKAAEKAPDTFTAVFTTTKGDFEVAVTREWSPLGADRFYNLVKIGYFQDIAFFRAVDNFMVQFGIHGDPKVSAHWRAAPIKDDAQGKASNEEGYITFATSGPNSRTVQMFINYKNNAGLDRQGFTPFGKVTSGMDIVKSLYKGYGDAPSPYNPGGKGPNQGRIQGEGNTYLKKDFPQLDYIKSAKLK